MVTYMKFGLHNVASSCLSQSSSAKLYINMHDKFLKVDYIGQ